MIPRTRRSLLTAAGLAAAAVFLVSQATVSPRAQALGERDVHKELGYLTVKDGTKIGYMVYRPTKEGRYPVLLQYDPYASGGLPWNEHVQDYLQHGYAVVGANVRGAGCSGGAFSLFAPHEGSDGAQLVDHLGAMPWSTGAVGMVGNSYPGHTQILTGAHRPASLKALAAGGLTSSIYREAFRPGGIMNVSFASRWSFLGQPNGSRTAAAERIKMGDTACEATVKQQPPNRTFDDVRDHPLHDEFWDVRALDTYVGKVGVPMMIVQGWQDHQTAMGGPRLFEQLRVPRKMILQTGGHGVYRRSSVRAEVIRWMDRWLKGTQNGIDKEPAVTVWFEVSDTPAPKANWSASYSGWPIAETQWQLLHLTAGGELRPQPPTAAPDTADRTYTFPSGTELVGNNVQFANPPDVSGALTYRTAPMADDLGIVGSPQLAFWVTSDRDDTDFMVALHDVSPEGDTLYLQRGFLRASMRTIDQTRSAPHHLFLPFSRVAKVTPGTPYEVKFSMPAVGHVFRKGHQMELVIMAPSATPTPDWGLMPLDLPGRNTVHHAPSRGATLRLPVVPGLRAQAPPPACGSTEFQPCRQAPRQAPTSAANR
jgi:putative CocE/NonD family hydrolase